MNRQQVLFIIYIGLILILLFSGLLHKDLIIVTITIIWVCYQFFIFYNQATNKLHGEFEFKVHSKKIRAFLLILALIPTLGYFFAGKFSFIQVFVFWTVVVFDVLVSLITKKLKPISFIINGKLLTFNNASQTRRDLTELKSISLNGMTEEIKMQFNNSRSISIYRNEFSTDDIAKLVEICEERSSNPIFISENLKNGNNLTAGNST